MESELTGNAAGAGLITHPPKQEYIPTNLEVLRDYGIIIKFLSRGCVVNVGCKEIPFETIEGGMQAIKDYVTNPYEERKKWEQILK